MNVFRRLYYRYSRRHYRSELLVQSENPMSAISRGMSDLLHGCVSNSDELGQRVAHLTREIAGHDWLELYSRVKDLTISRADLRAMSAMSRDTAVELLGVASLNSDGHIREAAIVSLADMLHPRSIPYLLLRLGDWVAPVRLATDAALRQTLTLDVASELLRHHTLIEHLRRVERVDLSQWVSDLYDYLRTPANVDAVHHNLSSEDRGTRLFAYTILAGDSDVFMRAIADPDPTIRAWSSRLAARDLQNLPDTIIRQLIYDRNARVSTPIIRALGKELRPRFTSDLRELALADAKSVRAAARFVLQDGPPIDFAGECRRRLHESTHAVRPGWVACLGEVGSAEDYELVARYLDHARSEVRVAAVLASARLDRPRAIDAITALLNDASGLVRRAVVNVLISTEPTLWIYQTRRIFSEASVKGRIAALNCLTSCGSWACMPDLLRAVSADHDDICLRAWQKVCEWQRFFGTKGWIVPSPEVREEIIRMWPSIQSDISPPLWAESQWRELMCTIENIIEDATR